MRNLNDLIEALRGELLEYAEMLVRLDDEPQARPAPQTPRATVARSVGIREQQGILAATLCRRQQAQRRLAERLHLPEETRLAELVPLLPRPYQLLVQALIDENQELSASVKQRTKDQWPDSSSPSQPCAGRSWAARGTPASGKARLHKTVRACFRNGTFYPNDIVPGGRSA